MPCLLLVRKIFNISFAILPRTFSHPFLTNLDGLERCIIHPADTPQLPTLSINSTFSLFDSNAAVRLVCTSSSIAIRWMFTDSAASSVSNSWGWKSLLELEESKSSLFFDAFESYLSTCPCFIKFTIHFPPAKQQHFLHPSASVIIFSRLHFHQSILSTHPLSEKWYRGQLKLPMVSKAISLVLYDNVKTLQQNVKASAIFIAKETKNGAV